MFKIKKILTITLSIIFGFICNFLWVRYGNLLYPKSVFYTVDAQSLVIAFMFWFVGVIVATSIINKQGKIIFVLWVIFLSPLVDLYFWVMSIIF